LSTASVRAISTLVWRGIGLVDAADAPAAAVLADLVNSFEFEHAPAGKIA
jgi:hypothetical protein